MPKIATADRVGREQLIDFVRTRHRVTLVATRGDGRPQISPVTAGVDDLGRITVDRWGPIATGGFPPDRAPSA